MHRERASQWIRIRMDPMPSWPCLLKMKAGSLPRYWARKLLQHIHKGVGGCQTPALNQGPSPAEGPSEGGHGTSRAPTSAPLGWSSGQPTAIQEPGWCRQANQGLPELVQNPAGTKQAELGGKWDFCPLPPFFLIYFLNIYINHPLPQLFELCYI